MPMEWYWQVMPLGLCGIHCYSSGIVILVAHGCICENPGPAAAADRGGVCRV